MKEANRGKTTKIISNFLSYPFHLDAMIMAESGGTRAHGGKKSPSFVI